MEPSTFSFVSSAGGNFTVVGFTGTEGISQLYRFDIKIKASVDELVDLDDILDSEITFTTSENGQDYPIYGVLASFDELQTALGHVYYKAVLVPKFWTLSIYKTNEVYTTEKTVDLIIQTVLENAGFSNGTDFEIGFLNTTNLLIRDYVCQFAESDFDFISRICENEGIFYYFDQSGINEKIIFINDAEYTAITEPELFYETSASKSNVHKTIESWICRKQRLPANVSLRDYNPSQPSQDISGNYAVDSMGVGTDYQYGGHILSTLEAETLSELRGEELLCKKTRYYAESSVARQRAGYSFTLNHTNPKYDGYSYLVVEITHEAKRLDKQSISDKKERSYYRNSFTAIETSLQFRPELVTNKPRFYGTMTAFIYAEASGNIPEVDIQGRYRVLLPFDRVTSSASPDSAPTKASTWIRMAQPYVGQDQGVYMPLSGGTEILLTFINGDPDQPIISGAIPNGSQPSLLENNPEWTSAVSKQTQLTISGNTHNITTCTSLISANSTDIGTNAGDISANALSIGLLENPPPSPIPTAANAHFINGGEASMSPPWEGTEFNIAEKNNNTPYDASDAANGYTAAYDESLMKFKVYDKDFVATDMDTTDLDLVSTDRSAGDSYIYANARTFAYPQHERVYFIGSFHEDFHLKDGFMDTAESHTGTVERFTFPAPGVYDAAFDSTKSESEVNPTGVRGLSEDKRWGDQMTFAYGRSFNYSGGTHLAHPGEQADSSDNDSVDANNDGFEDGSVDGDKDGGAFGQYNYGNGYVENLITRSSGTSVNIPTDDKKHHDDWKKYTEFTDKLGSSSIDLTFGQTYSYHNGYSLDIKVGDSKSKTYGNSDDRVEGDSRSHVIGDSTSTVDGDSSETIHGHSDSMTFGSSSDTRHGATSDMHMGASSSMFLGATNDMSISISNEMHVGISIGLEVAGFLKATVGAGIDCASARITSEITAVKASPVTVAAGATRLQALGTHLKNAGIGISNAGISIFS